MRFLLVLVLAVACAGRTPAPARTGPLNLVVFGGKTDVAVFAFDPATGGLAERTRVAMPGRSAYMAVSPDRRFAYAGHGEAPGHVTAFALAPTGALTRLNDVSSAPDGDALGISHIAVHPDGRWLLSAHLKSGRISVMPLLPDGQVARPTFSQILAMGAHQVVTVAGGRHALIPVRDGQFVASFGVDTALGRFVPNRPDRVASPPGSGPRHLALSPDERFAYVNNESNGTVTAYRLEAAHGALTQLATYPSVPADYKETGTGHILVHASGRFVYASNRFHGSIAVYARDAGTGALTLVEVETAGGELNFPRDFDIDPAGRFMIVGNEKADSLSVLRIDPGTGALERAQAPVPAPVGPQVVIAI